MASLVGCDVGHKGRKGFLASTVISSPYSHMMEGIMARGVFFAYIRFTADRFTLIKGI